MLNRILRKCSINTITNTLSNVNSKQAFVGYEHEFKDMIPNIQMNQTEKENNIPIEIFWV